MRRGTNAQGIAQSGNPAGASLGDIQQRGIKPQVLAIICEQEAPAGSQAQIAGDTWKQLQEMPNMERLEEVRLFA